MLDPDNVPPVTPDELVARFIYVRRNIRNSDNTIKPDAFMPHPRIKMSVTRHIAATEEEIWTEGLRVGEVRNLPLQGRGDFLVGSAIAAGIEIVSEKIPENPNHADGIGWPADKGEQKMKATEIAKAATLQRYGDSLPPVEPEND